MLNVLTGQRCHFFRSRASWQAESSANYNILLLLNLSFVIFYLAF